MAAERFFERLSKYMPRLGLCAFMVCLFSGAVLCFQYRPFGNVFRNIEEITTLVPFGWFFRQIHYVSGQVFTVLMLFHTADHFIRRRYLTYPPGTWSFLILSLCLCFLTLFTGFILKGDMEGIFAGRIFMNIMGTIPIAGKSSAALFVRPGEGFFFLPFLHHCLILPLIIVVLLRVHIREWLPGTKYFTVTILGLSLYALLVDPFPDIPPDAHVAEVKGPWFFLGIQSLLKTMDPLTAGLIVPCAFLAALFLLPVTGKTVGRFLHYTVAVSFLMYAVLTIRSAIWGP